MRSTTERRDLRWRHRSFAVGSIAVALGCSAPSPTPIADAGTRDAPMLDAASLGSDGALDAARSASDGAPDDVAALDAPLGEGGGAPDRSLIVRAADAILDRQTPEGALLVGVATLPESRLVPYFGNLAASALCLATEETGDPRYADAARRWLDWFAEHQNDDGTIYDYQWSAGTYTSTGTYDSTDSYAATFVDAIRVCRDATGDASLATAWQASVEAAVRAIDSTMQPDRLTWATPTYRVQYLMDNVEVHRGLASASMLALAWSREVSRSWELNGDLTRGSIETLLWSEEAARYWYARNDDGTRESMPGVWYPDTMAQLMAIAWLPPEAHRSELYATLRDGLLDTDVGVAILDDDDGERAVFWMMAARSAGDDATLARIAALFEAMDWTAVLLRTPADYGHLIRALAGR
jgi:hypothetical protein